MARSESGGVSAPGVYVWEVPGKPVSVQISLDVVDRLQQDVMRGFGAVPKRGAEVGGILLGSVESKDGPRVLVDDFELIPIEYKRGPSYLLSEADLKVFTEAVERLGARPELVPVGFFRSQTRDTAGLAQEDFDLLARFLPQPEAVVLLIKPYATRVCMAGFYFQEDGRYQSGPPLAEFPFRRKELSPEGAVVPSVRDETRGSRPPAAHRHDFARSESAGPAAGEPAPAAKPVFSSYAEAKRPRRGWVWVPLSFIFLLLGVLLGFQAAFTMRPTAPGGDPYALALTVDKSGDNLHVKWDRQALAIRTAQKGILSIDDGAYNKTVDLDPGQLQTGSVVYHHNSNHVRFRLEVYPKDRSSLAETQEWNGQ